MQCYIFADSHSFMKILVVAATRKEIEPLIAASGDWLLVDNSLLRKEFNEHLLDVLVTGVGMTATAARTGIALSNRKYDLAVNAGICGSFNPQLKIGEVVNVVSDFFPEMGAENEDGLLHISELNLQDNNDFPFSNGILINHSVSDLAYVKTLRHAKGATVNTVHGKESSIAAFHKSFNADIESMEGAAFMYVCNLMKIKFIQIRSVSNYVEKRNPANWNIPLAISNLNTFLFKYLAETGFQLTSKL